MLCLSYYCLCLLLNKIGEKGRTVSAWKWGGRGGGGGGGARGEKWSKQCMHIWINEFKKKRIKPFLQLTPTKEPHTRDEEFNPQTSKPWRDVTAPDRAEPNPHGQHLSPYILDLCSKLIIVTSLSILCNHMYKTKPGEMLEFRHG
jgi:hypothetical protein